MKKNWKIKERNSIGKRIFPDLEEEIELLLLDRGIDNTQKKQAFIAPSYETETLDPFLLKDMDLAVGRALSAIKKKEKICIYGDYDADGVTASTLLLDFFAQIEVETVAYLPDRATEGYGINIGALDYLKERDVTLMITVDCGVSNAKEVEYAKELGIDSIILDHHHLPAQMPKAVAVVDHKRDDDLYPNKDLAGVGVAFKFLQALASKMDNYDSNQLKWLLDLVAIGTIADCVDLSSTENRMLVKFGLYVLSKTKRVGLHHLFQVGRIKIDEHNIPSSYDVSFQIAPRINAAGRMDHANSAQKLLLCNKFQEAQARLLALEIEDQNKYRQKVTTAIVDEVFAKIASREKEKMIIESSPNWNFGVVGLAAGKVAEAFHRPTILFQKYEKEGEKLMRASCRSIPKFNIVEALEKNKDLLLKYGGHSQAAGLTLKEENFEAFQKRMQLEMKDIDDKDLVKEISIDVALSLEKITNKLVNELSLLEPYGSGNGKPIFCSENLKVSEVRTVGNGDAHLKLQVQNEKGQRFLDAIGFSIAKKFKEVKVGSLIDLAFNLEMNEWNGNRNPQAMIVDINVK
jgi:single-stranded-DNA-specific exonuclease